MHLTLLCSRLLRSPDAGASPAFAASALQVLDPDKDGTVDLNEAKAAASALFDKLERTTTAPSTARSCMAGFPTADWAMADPDNDKTISKDEYLAYRRSRLQKGRHGQRRND